jgi:hypothetical protein
VSLAAVLLLACGLMAGCGRVGYKLKPGTTLYYEYATNKGFVSDEQMAESPTVRNSTELRLKVLQDMPDIGYGLDVSAHPMKDQGVSPFGSNYGGYSLNMKHNGAMANQGGMGLPPGMDINLLILRMPSGWMRPGKTWKENRNVQIMQESKKADYTWRYMGVETVAGRPCHHFQGTSIVKDNPSIPMPRMQITINLEMKLDIKTDYYLSREGYPLKCRSIEKRARRISNAGTGDVLFDKTDFLDSEITFLRIK